MSIPHTILTFTLVLSRVAGILLTAPVLGTRNLRWQLRLAFAASIAFLITPLQVAGFSAVPTPPWPQLLLMAARELTIGLTLGFGIAILFAGFHLASNLIGQLSGMSLAAEAPVVEGGATSPVGRFVDMISVTVFVAVGGHRIVLAALMDTYRWLPLGRAELAANAGTVLAGLLTQSFSLGLRSAMPITAALLTAAVLMGILSRAAPQLGIWSTGLGLHTLTLLAVLSLALGTVTWTWQDELGPMMSESLQLWSPSDTVPLNISGN